MSALQRWGFPSLFFIIIKVEICLKMHYYIELKRQSRQMILCQAVCEKCAGPKIRCQELLWCCT